MEINYKFNDYYIVRIEYWGGLLINPSTNQEFLLDFTNAVFLKLIYEGINYDKAIKVLKDNGLDDKLFIDNFLQLKVIEPCCKRDVENESTIIKEIFNEKEMLSNTNYLSAPIQVSLYLTYSCQLNCKFCYFKEKRKFYKDTSVLDLESWKKVIDELKKINVVYVSLLGGEPTLHKDIYEILKYLDFKKIKTTITTNGVNWSDKLIDFVSSSKYITPSISLQSLKENLNIELMGCSSKFALNLADRFIEKGKSLRINTVITNQSKEDLIDLINYCKSKGIDDFFTNIYLDKFDKEYSLKARSFSQYKHLKLEIMKYLKENEIDINFQMQGCLFYSAYPEESFSLESDYEFIKYGCEAGNTKVEIMPNGDLYPCTAFSLNDFEYCNVLKNSVKYIWNNAPYLKLLRNYKNEDSTCVNCKFYKFCNGGCPAYNLRDRKSLVEMGDKRCSILQMKN